MTPIEIELRLQAIKTRRAEIFASLAASKAAFFATGVKRPYQERLTLEAEAAALYVEERSITQRAIEARIQRRKELNASLLAELQRLLVERGLDWLIDEAAERSRVSLESLGS